MSRRKDLLVVAGEASGDMHGARLLSELSRLVPGLRSFGLGGDELAAAGLEVLVHSREISVVGVAEVFTILPQALRAFSRILAEVDRRGVRTAVLIDFPDFNLLLARRLVRRGVRVIYYISPQVWAWRPGRVRLIARLVDRMLVLLPFEVEFYRRHGVDVEHVGHPLVDEVPQLANVWQKGPPSGPLRLALLPGSRRSEVEALLPEMLRAAARIAADLPVEVRLIAAPTLPRGELEAHVAASGVAAEIVSQGRFAEMAASHLALCASGTATLELGLLGTPMLVLYRIHFWTYLLARWLVHLPYVSLVNLVAGGPVVPELMQQEARADRIATQAVELLRSPERIATMRRELGRLRQLLGEPGASARAAACVAAYLDAEPAA